MAKATERTPADRAQQRAKYLSGLLWHVGAFVILNAFFWVLDLSLGQDGAQWAYWITGFWALALAFHALGYFIDGRQLEDRKAKQYLEEDRQDRAL